MNDEAIERSETEPTPSRLVMPRGYQVPTGTMGLIPWARAVERLEQAQNYWLATTNPEGRPHVTPVWGVWVEGALYFDGIPSSRWARNLDANPALAVHLESGEDVLILEGLAEDLVIDPDLGARVIEAWSGKYGRLQPKPVTDGIFRLRPRVARAWSQFPEDATRFRFEAL
ncbi:MAG: pyridoxamine 5'-phosphate oxidase family protein [Chloroflexota bacterium]|nr:pyridoxamine 5'-phosphate oxidase family protein [Chloroflexota bacterium]